MEKGAGSGADTKLLLLAALAMLEQLALNNPPSVKQYHEAIAATLLLSHPDLLEQQLLPHLVKVDKGSAYTGSLILVAVQAVLHLPASRQLTLLPKLLKLLLPWTNHHNHNVSTSHLFGTRNQRLFTALCPWSMFSGCTTADSLRVLLYLQVRTFAQLGFGALTERFPLQEWPGWQEGLGEGGCEVAAHLLRFMHENVEFQASVLLAALEGRLQVLLQPPSCLKRMCLWEIIKAVKASPASVFVA